MAQQLMQGNNGQLSQQQMAQLERLAQQQELLQKSMEQLEREARNSGNSKRLPANLKDITKEMQEVVTEMKSQRLDQDLIQKQERILSRLLDAQRSINERDYEWEREANTGANVNRQSPPGITPERSIIDKFNEELMNAQREGYNADYQELIRKYLEKLQKVVGRN
jgi:hypothetical protein